MGADDRLRLATENLANYDESKYFKEFTSLFNLYKGKEYNPYSSVNEDIMDIRADSGFSKYLTFSQYAKLLSLKPQRKVELPKCWQKVLDDYFLETVPNGGPKTIHDWAQETDELNVIKDNDDKETTKFKNYLNRVMSPIIESFLKPLPDIRAQNTTKGHYWSVFVHQFFSKALQDFVNLDWRIMAPVNASKYRKHIELDHKYQEIVNRKSADILARTWETGEELFVGEQIGSPTEHDITKVSFYSFKLRRELRECLNVRILQALELGDINYNDRLVFGILGYLYDVKMMIMWKDGVYVYEEFGTFTIASNPNMIHKMKASMIKLLKFMMIIKNEVSKIPTINSEIDDIQILKRKFYDGIKYKILHEKQTKELPIKKQKR